MKKLGNLLSGYLKFRQKYVEDEKTLMHELHTQGQSPQVMVVSCCDSRVDPALILQCDPGDLFVVRNIANIVPPYETDSAHHGTSAALEFGIKSLQVKHLIIMAHSECGGIKAWVENKKSCDAAKNAKEGFLDNWLSIIDVPDYQNLEVNDCAKFALKNSYNNCLSFPWIKEKLDNKLLEIHLWFFDIKSGNIQMYSWQENKFTDLVCDLN